MTLAEKRNRQDLTLAYAIELTARQLLSNIEKAKSYGLTVDCNVGTRYATTIGGYVRVHRAFKYKATKVLDVDLIPRNPHPAQEK